MNDPFRKIVVDIDDTLCIGTEGKDYANAVPIVKTIAMVNRYHDAGYHVTIFTARGMHRFSGDAAACDRAFRGMTEAWLDRHGVRYDVLLFGKPSADLYLDDKAIRPDEFAARDPK